LTRWNMSSWPTPYLLFFVCTEKNTRKNSSPTWVFEFTVVIAWFHFGTSTMYYI
jgi:hypothetical protein